VTDDDLRKACDDIARGLFDMEAVVLVVLCAICAAIGYRFGRRNTVD
jgi:hypothetical protein